MLNRLTFLACALLGALTLLPAQSSSVHAEELYLSEPGPHEIRMREDIVLADPARGKSIPLRVTYPVGDDPVPAIVFSHGAWAAKFFYAPMSRHWASHGFAVIQPTHEDSSELGQRWDDFSVFAEPMRFGRVKDISRIIDVINELGIEGLDGRIDPERIAVGGHSYGADTAMMAAGLFMVDPASGKKTDLHDERIKAVISMSGQGLGEGRTTEGFQAVTIPFILITGSRDFARGGRPPDWRLDSFNEAGPGNKFLVFVEGLDHGLGGSTDADPDYPQPPEAGVRNWRKDAMHVAVTKSSTTAFLEAFLNADEEARAFLSSDAIARATDGLATVKEK